VDGLQTTAYIDPHLWWMACRQPPTLIRKGAQATHILTDLVDGPHRAACVDPYKGTDHPHTHGPTPGGRPSESAKRQYSQRPTASCKMPAAAPVELL